MYLIPSLPVLILGQLTFSIAAPNPAELQDLAIDTASCNRDDLYRPLIDPLYSSSARAFCSTYLRSTSSAVGTTEVDNQPAQPIETLTPYLRKTITRTATPPVEPDLPTTTAFPSSRLSSACSCIVTTTTKPTTLSPSTKTNTPTATAPPTCTDARVVVTNGDFETGSLAPWTLLSNDPDLRIYSNRFFFNVTSPGYNDSKYAFTVTDESATTYVQVTIGQSVPVCPGRKYKFSARLFINNGETESFREEQHAELFVDDIRVAAAPDTWIYNYRVFVWKRWSATFTANSTTAAVKVALWTTNYMYAQWGLDNVVIVPV
ncbi:MAG: hypothetical protein L6R40_007152 [Gallowayella cf. fulva]|nr:MAG: hypothetical protein L6R40_007152 [Xanthomendoza cf. fulva]